MSKQEECEKALTICAELLGITEAEDYISAVPSALEDLTRGGDPDDRRFTLGYEEGQRRAGIDLIRTGLRMLPGDRSMADALLACLEREEAISVLRDVCEVYGDNDWGPGLHLSDIIEEHLVGGWKGKIEAHKERSEELRRMTWVANSFSRRKPTGEGSQQRNLQQKFECSGCSWSGLAVDLAKGEEDPECPECGLSFEGVVGAEGQELSSFFDKLPSSAAMGPSFFEKLSSSAATGQSLKREEGQVASNSSPRPDQAVTRRE